MNTAHVTPESSHSYLDPRGFLRKVSRQNLWSSSRKIMVGPEVTARELTSTRNKEKLALVAPPYLPPAPYASEAGLA